MTHYFPEVAEPVRYEGRDTTNPLAFRYYNADQIVAGKTMRDHLRFAICYWHTFQYRGSDPFGEATFLRPWFDNTNSLAEAENRQDAAFEFFQKMGVPYYTFHDRDIAPEGANFGESCKNLEHIVQRAKRKQEESGIKLLWGTANLFSNRRYTHGAGTNPDAHVYAYAAAQAKHAIAATHELGGENYVFWGGREGYETILNTDMKREQENFANFLHMAVAYAKEIGFSGQFLIEPKPMEPTKHQYDVDSATVLNFLRAYDLFDHFKINHEPNHSTLAGHATEHDLTVAASAGKLGSIDANRGDPQNGWDTDQFPTDIHANVMMMLVVLKHGGLGSGGLNFDAKPRRSSVDLVDMFYAHIGGMDSMARALLTAQKIIDDGILSRIIEDRYASYSSGIGAKISKGESNFAELEQYVLEHGEPNVVSGRQEMIENLINSYL
ncbi:MAG: xylose isomerase [SAR324 cluster bacterium]|nr:xylose isomerase [SAR324 cluster bacterium]